MTAVLELVTDWKSYGLFLLIFGLMPGHCIRFLNLCWPAEDERRAENLATLEYLPLWRRPLYVTQLVAPAVWEGLAKRRVSRRRGRGVSYMEARRAATVRFDWSFLVFTGTGVTVPLFLMISALNPWMVHAMVVGLAIMIPSGIYSRIMYLRATGRTLDRRDFPPMVSNEVKT